jgi:hypothetical protein
LPATTSNKKSTPVPKSRRYLTGVQVDERYQISSRTRKNWVARKILPPPVVIHNREYYDENALDALDAERTLQITDETTKKNEEKGTTNDDRKNSDNQRPAQQSAPGNRVGRKQIS